MTAVVIPLSKSFLINVGSLLTTGSESKCKAVFLGKGKETFGIHI